MNNTVTAKGIEVKARAESGIVIKAKETNTGAAIPTTAATFKTTADWAMSAGTELYPVSTVDAANWYTAISDEKDNAKAGQASANYTKLTAGYANYYAKYDYVIRSAA